MRIESLEYFVTIAKGATFMDAAMDHNLSQSSLSKAIIGLEKELGVKLLDRSHYPVTLTKAGQQFFEDLKSLSPGFRKLRRHIKAFQKNQDISCVVVPSAENFGLRVMFDQFRKQYEHIPLVFTHVLDANLAVTALHKEEVDFCIMHKPFVPKPQIKMTTLANDALCVLLNSNHPLASSQRISIYSLREDNFLTTQYSYTILRDLGETVVAMPPLIQKNIRHINVLEDISYGEGVTVYYESDLEFFKLKNITVRPLADLPNNPLVLAEFTMAELTESKKIFRDFVISNFRHGAANKSEG
jgi:DNA-binding transcriptional LysR family regulator